MQTPPGDSPDKKEAEKSGGDSNKVGNKPSKIDNEKIPGDSPATHDTPVGESQEETPEGDSSPPSDYSDVAASPGWYRGEAERQAAAERVAAEREAAAKAAKLLEEAAGWVLWSRFPLSF